MSIRRPIGGCWDVDWPALSVLFQHAVDRSTKAVGQIGRLSDSTADAHGFVETWGDPTYTHQQFTHFFGMQDGRLIPQARLALGSPAGGKQGWRQAMRCSRVCRSWVLPGFLEGVLVYHEAMTAEKVHAVGKTWKYESQFKTRLESSPGLK